MTYDPKKHHRRSIRLQGYDYSQEGAYFITICTYQKECILGNVEGDPIALNPIGEIALKELLRPPEFHKSLELDALVVMPNHIHAILTIGAENTARTAFGEIVRRYKIFSAKAINQQRNVSGVAVWQRDFYERIIGGEAMLNAIRQYIENNPSKWLEDVENPAFEHQKRQKH